MSLYGVLPIYAIKDFMSKIPKDIPVTQVWIYLGKFLDKYYTDHQIDNFKVDPKVVDALIQSYDDQHHSGYSHLVVTQMIFEYLSGKMSDEKRRELK